MDTVKRIANWHVYIENNKGRHMKIILKSGFIVDELKVINSATGYPTFDWNGEEIKLDEEEIAGVVLKKVQVPT